MRRIALFSDVHANLPALEAVLDDIVGRGIEEVYCLGDLVGYGPEPGAVIERVRRADIPTIQGNYDEGVGTRRGECGCYYATEQAKADGAASYSFTESALTGGQLDWLAGLPKHLRVEDDGISVLLAHGSPRKINEYLLPDREDRQLARLAEEADAEVVCVGHVHIPYHRALLGGDERHIHYVSSGSAGKPKDGDPRAGWVELVLGAQGAVRGEVPEDAAAAPVGRTDTWLGVKIHRVAYDVESVAEAMLAAGLPPTLAEALRRG